MVPPMDEADARELEGRVGKGAPILGLLGSAWRRLWKEGEGLKKSIPNHPWEMLDDFYTKNAKDKRDFKIQKFLQQEMDDLLGDMLFDSRQDDPAAAARIISNSDGGAGAWLRVAPTKRSLCMDPLTFKQAVAIRCSVPPVGLPEPGVVCRESTPCIEKKQQITLPHALSCCGLAGRTDRHNAIVSDVFHWLGKRKVMVKKEYRVNPLNAMDRIDLWVRTDDAVIHWCDVSVPEPSNPSRIAKGSHKKELVAAKAAEAGKRRDWGDKAKRAGAVARPLVLETTGRLGEDFNEFLSIVEATSEGPSRGVLVSQMSVTLAKWNVNCVREAGRKACGQQI